MWKRLLLPLLVLALAGGCGAPQSAPLPSEGQVEAVVAQALLDQAASGYLRGECVAEGHDILRVDHEGEALTVYLIASVGQYGFCSGHFEEVSGSGPTPTRITFTQEEDGSLTVTDHWVPMDGSYYDDSIKETFPLTLQLQALSAQDHYEDLKAQKQAYAQAYLESIGREAPIGDYGDFDHPLETDLGMVDGDTFSE